MFLHPEFLALLAVPPTLAALAFARRGRARRRAALLAGAAAASRTMPRGGPFAAQTLLFATALALGVVALARPQWGERREKVALSTRNVLLLLDVSRSMLASDVHPTRLGRAKADLADLALSLQGDRASLVAFRSAAVTVCPFTTDAGFLLEALEGVDPDSAPRGETDLGKALESALADLKKLGDSHNAIILVSDGEDLTGRARRAAAECGARGIPVFCVGVGTARGGAVPDGAGGTLRHRGEPVVSRLDGRTLAEIASASGGVYLPVEATAAGSTTLGTIYRDHVRRIVEAEEREEELSRRPDRFQWFLAPALAMMLLALALSAGRPAAAPRRAGGGVPRRTGGKAGGAESGQILPMALFAALALVFAALWLADVHHAVRVRGKTQDAGDAAALEAARWQGASLNLAGELNLAHLMAVAVGDARTAEAVTNAQTRLLYAGPLSGFAAAQHAAKLNGIPGNDEFSEFVRAHAALVRRGYGDTLDGTASSAISEPWPGAWNAYADALESIAAGKVAAGVDNARFFDDPAGAHFLLDPGFYAAVRGRDWCWFHRNAPDLPRTYRDFRSWPPLPGRDPDPPAGSEILGLGLRFVLRRAASFADGSAVVFSAATAAGFDALATAAGADALKTNSAWGAWLAFDSAAWGQWLAMKDPAFPLAGTLRKEYDTVGADAAMRVEGSLARISRQDPAGDGVSVWTGAAKPFGFLRAEESGAKLSPPAASSLVLPAWNAVRLVPLDAVNPGGGGTFDLRWRRHCLEHLPPYLERGVPALDPTCRRCQALARWENPELRERARGWIETNSWRCTTSPPGNSPGGGSAHAH